MGLACTKLVQLILYSKWNAVQGLHLNFLHILSVSCDMVLQKSHQGLEDRVFFLIGPTIYFGGVGPNPPKKDCGTSTEDTNVMIHTFKTDIQWDGVLIRQVDRYVND